MKDIVLVKSAGLKDSPMIKIQPQDVYFPAKIRSLSLFLRYKMELVEGHKDALGKSVMCSLSVTVKLWNSEGCYRDAPVEQIGEHRFMSLENRMLMKESTKVPCVRNFPRIVQIVSAWIWIGPKVV